MGKHRSSLPALCLISLALLRTAAPAAAAGEPDVEARADRDPDPGDAFALTFTIRSHQTASYTIIVSPRPEFAFVDMSNGSKTAEIPGGTTSDLSFDMQVSRSARQGSYLVSYSVQRDNATIKMGTVEIKVGSLGSCTSFMVLVPLSALAVGVAVARRPGR